MALTIPHTYTAGGQRDASTLDDNNVAIRDYINNREVVTGLLASRPAAGTAGRWYVATDVNGGTAYVDTGVAWVQVAASVTGASAQLFRSYLAGLRLANNGTDAEHDIDIAVGEARADDDTDDIALGTLLTKRIDAAWVVGNNEGGLDTGTVTTTRWYHVFLIKRPDTGVVDALFSLSATTPTLPANYTKQRRLGAVLTNGSSNLVAFSQRGDEFLWAVPVLDVNATNQGTSAVLQALSVPAGVQVEAIYNLRTSAVAVYISAPDASDQAPSASGAAPLSSAANAGAAMVHGPSRVRTNTSSEVRSRIAASGAGENFQIATLGWVDRRGQDD
jgi:hypothetical protein